MESYVCICHCHCCMQVISFLLVSDSFTFETTNDICAFSLNYTLLLFHNGIYCVPCSTNSIQLNTCAEVSAFTPPTTHPPLQSRTYQPTQSQPQQHICSSRLLLDAVGMLSSCRCVRILVGLFHTRVVLFEVKQHEATALAVIVLWNYLCMHLRDNRHHTMFHFSVFFLSVGLTLDSTQAVFEFTEVEKITKTQWFSDQCVCRRHSCWQRFHLQIKCRISTHPNVNWKLFRWKEIFNS